MKIKFISNHSIFNERYDNVYDSGDSSLKIVSKDGLWGVINNKGEETIPLIYYDIEDFLGDYIIVKNKNGWGVVNKNNEIIIPLENISVKSKILKNDEDFLFVGAKEKSLTIFYSGQKELINLSTDDAINLFKKPIHYSKFLNTELIIIGLNDTLEEKSESKNFPVYLVKQDSNLTVLKINKSAYYKTISSILDEGIRENPPSETNFKIVKTFLNFVIITISEYFFGYTNYYRFPGFICKLENNELVPIIPFNIQMSSVRRPSEKSLKEIEEVVKDSHTHVGDRSTRFPTIINIMDKNYIYVYDSGYSEALYNIDGSIFIPFGCSRLYVPKYSDNNHIVGLKKEKIVYFDLTTGKEIEKEENQSLENYIYETDCPGIFISFEQEDQINLNKYLELNNFNRESDSKERLLSFVSNFLTTMTPSKFYLCDKNNKKITEKIFTSAQTIKDVGGSCFVVAHSMDNKIFIINKMHRISHIIDADGIVFSKGDNIFTGKALRSSKVNTSNFIRRGWLFVDSYSKNFRNTKSYSGSEEITLKDQPIIIWKDSKLGMLDSNFKTIIPLIYDDLFYKYDDSDFKDYVVVRKDLNGFISEEKIKELTKDDPELFKTLSERPTREFRIQGNYGVITTKNEPVLPFIFSSIKCLNHKGRGTLFDAKLIVDGVETGFKINKNNLYQKGKKFYKLLMQTPRELFVGTMGDRTPYFFQGYEKGKTQEWTSFLDSVPESIKELININIKKDMNILNSEYSRWLSEAERDAKKVAIKAKEEAQKNKRIEEKPGEQTSKTPDNSINPSSNQNIVTKFNVTQLSTGRTAEITGEGADYIHCLQNVQKKVLDYYPNTSVGDYSFEPIN